MLEKELKSGTALEQLKMSPEMIIERLKFAEAEIELIHPKTTDDFNNLVKIKLWRANVNFLQFKDEEGIQIVVDALKLSHSILGRFNFHVLDEANKKAADQTIRIALQLIATYIKLATEYGKDALTLKEGIEYCRKAFAIYDTFVSPTIKLINADPVNTDYEKQLFISLCGKQIDVLLTYSKKANAQDALGQVLEAKELVQELSLLQAPEKLMVFKNQIARQECDIRFSLSEMYLALQKYDEAIQELKGLIEAATTLKSMKTRQVHAMKKLLDIYFHQFELSFEKGEASKSREYFDSAATAFAQLKQLTPEGLGTYDKEFDEKLYKLKSMPTPAVPELEKSDAQEESPQATKRPARKRTYGFIGGTPNVPRNQAKNDKTSPTDSKTPKPFDKQS